MNATPKRRHTVSQVVRVGRLVRRPFLRAIAELQAVGIDIRADVISSGLLDADYKVTVRATNDEAAIVDRALASML